MDFKDPTNRKYLAIISGIILLIIASYLLIDFTGKTDDWRYSHVSEDRWMIYAVIVAVTAFAIWLTLCIYLIVKGKPNDKGVNAKRRLGISILISPIIISLIMIAIFSMGFVYIVFATPLIISGLIIWGIVYSVKNDAKIAILPILLTLFALILPMLGLSYFGVMDASRLTPEQSMSLGGNIGFSVGGAKDINNFRENVANNYLPLSTDITYEGLFYDYYFDTGEKEECQELFCPSYSYAISKDPLSKEDEYYLSVGLNSGIKEEDFKRKKLNLVVVMDVSGSMGSNFNMYYYDQFGERHMIEGLENDTEDTGKSKMMIARESVVAMLDHLNPDDRFGMVLFDNSAYIGKPLSRVGETDMDAIKGHILDIQPRGGTNFEAGYKEGTALFEEYLDADQSEYENRIIFITDAMPNIGQTSEKGLFGMTESNANDKIYTTFIGVGVDFNTELIEYITKVKGANYYSVHSAKQFQNRLDEEFEYMVTPLVFNLSLVLDAKGYEIEKVYGSPEANEATGEIMKVNTLFPSKKEDSGTRGGIIILKLKKTSPDENLKLKVSYEDRTGKTDTNEEEIMMRDVRPDFYENDGIRKAILLSRYASLMKDWINDERESYTSKQPVRPTANRIDGIVVPSDMEGPELGRWERQSIPLQVSVDYKEIIEEFSTYFMSEMDAIGDSTLSKEKAVMDNLTS